MLNVRDTVLQGHTVYREFKDITLDQSIPCLTIFALLVFFVPFGSIFAAIINFIKPGAFDIKLNIDEDLHNYYEALEESDKKWMILEEDNLRRNYVSIKIYIIFEGYEDASG